ncbi:MAG: amidase [Planctomycetota bacterium]|jgi:aspartyl-tRNA(Asn)/glutamyl-tRNA(Gln) amidotransferase subunit A
MQLPATGGFTVSQIGADLAAGTRSSESIVEQCLARIDERESELQAWVIVDRVGAIDQARQLDRECAAGTTRGPLHGIPVGIKDIINVAGFVTGAGSPWMPRNEPATSDAPLVQYLRQAGAVILGKTVTTEFACFDPPPTRNPWNTDRTPGGSSSGSAAAVAAEMVPFAIGSQTGGSITRPASFCGVCGLKPTFGTVSVEGVVPVAPSLDHPGPIARCVADLRVSLAALVQKKSASTQTGRPLRLGRLRGFFEDRASKVMSQALQAVLDQLMSAGIQVFDIDVPDEFADVLIHHRRVMACEAAAWHRASFSRHRDDYGDCVASLIEEGLSVSAVDYLAARDHQVRLTAALNALASTDVDALVTPATTGVAPDTSTTGDPCMNAPWSYTGMPTVSVPIAVSDGLPLAMQFAAPRGGDWKLLDTAEQCEQIIRP